jgi:ABC-type anion transport system duplicated permease subunit
MMRAVDILESVPRLIFLLIAINAFNCRASGSGDP